MRHYLIYIVLAVPVFLASCAGRPSNDFPGVRIAVLKGPSAVEMVRLSDSLGRCDDPDLSVELFDEPLQLRKELLEGTVDFAVLPATMGALLYNKGMDYRAVAIPIWGSLYLCGVANDVSSLGGLKGKTVYIMGRGMTPDILFRHLLRSCGLKPDEDVFLDYSFPTHLDLANAAMAGRVGLCVLSEPYLSQVLNVRPDMKLLSDLGAEWRSLENNPLVETVFLCKGTLAGSDIVEKVVNACRSSAEWVLSHPDSAAVFASRLGINPDTAAIKASIPRSGFNVVDAGSVESEIKYYLSVFLDASPDAVGGRMPDENFIVK